MNSDSGNAQNSPNNPQPTQFLMPLSPFIPPEQAIVYNVVSSPTQITGHLSLPAAYLNNPPPKLAQEIAVMNRRVMIDVDGTRIKLPPESPTRTVENTLKPEERARVLIASVRYRGSGHTIYVNTATLTPAEAKMTRFSEKTKLADGTPAYTTVVEGINTPNCVVFIRGRVYVTIASDLPMEQIKSLATSVVLK
jgi:hypothetical protein